MAIVRASITAILVSSLAVGCGVGDASGPGSETGGGDGAGGGDGDTGGETGDGQEDDGSDDGGSSPDAGPSGGDVQCATEYAVGGQVDHEEEPTGTCDGSGLWEVSAANPLADPDSIGCGDAPAGETFFFGVTRAGDGYQVVDEDQGLTWTVQIRDKSGSCSATFTHEAGASVWSLIAGEDGPGGPLGGTARYEQRGQ